MLLLCANGTYFSPHIPEEFTGHSSGPNYLSGSVELQYFILLAIRALPAVVRIVAMLKITVRSSFSLCLKILQEIYRSCGIKKSLLISFNFEVLCDDTIKSHFNVI